jgi:hypothetical protein
MKSGPASVREELRQGLGYAMTLAHIFVMVGFPFWIWWGGLVGLAVDWVVVMSLMVLDYFTSPLSKRNIRCMNETGFSNLYVATCFSVNACIYWIPIAAPIWLFAATADEEPLRFDLRLVTNVILVLVVVEVWFTTSHKYLHRSIPQLHILHHCCVYPSMTTNFLFHPIDFAIEFGVPLALNGLICGCVVVDSLAMMVGYSVVIAWYTLDHDQYLQLEHWKHHRHTSGRYSIYVHYGRYDELDKVKPLIGRLKTE